MALNNHIVFGLSLAMAHIYANRCLFAIGTCAVVFGYTFILYIYFPHRQRENCKEGGMLMDELCETKSWHFT